MQTEPTIVIEVQEQKNEAVQPELLYSQLAAASAGADALDITMPADVPAAAEDTSEAPAVDVTSQHSVHDENGYYVYNGTENDTYNSLTKDGLWVGGVDDNRGFHVDNTGHASANGLDVQNQKITGVADGEFKAGSTDAVTAGQLYDAGIVPGEAADGSVAIGNGSTVTSGAWDWDTNTPLPANGVAIGDNAKVNFSAVNGVVIGQGAEVRTDNATAIGQGSRVVSGDGSVALGQGSMVTATDAKSSDPHGVVSVGLTGNKVTEGFTRRIINVADGINDSDAATYGQVKDVDAKIGDLDFSNTHSLKKAENVTDALTKLDTKAYDLSGKFDDFSRSGIMAGGTDAESRHAGADSIQLGNQSRAEGQQSIALGVHAKVTGENTEESIQTRAKNNGVAIGYSATAAGFNTTVLGAAAKAQGDNATALGQGTLVTADNSVALGAGSRVTTDDIRDSDTNGVVSVGKSDGERRIINVADGVNDSDAATVGQISKITGMDSEKGNVVQYDGEDKSTITFAGKNGTALNNVNDIVMNVKNPINKKTEQHSFQNAGLLPGKVEGKATSGKWNMAIGEGSEVAVDGGTGADMQFNTAIGNSAGVSQNIVDGDYVDVERSTAIGHAAKVSASNSTAIGDSSNAGEDNSVAVGQKAEVQSATSIAIGQGTKIGSNAENSIAIGTSANQYSVGSKAKNSTVVGVNAWSMAEGGTVLGKSAKIQGSAANGTAIGTNATINVSAGSGNVALGADSTVSKADVGGDTAHGVVSVGQSGDNGFTRRIINVADGVNDSDAATYGQVKAVQSDIDALDKRAVTYTDSKKEAVNFNKAKLQNIGDIQLGNATSTFVGSGLVNGKVYDTEKGQWAENGAEDTHSMAVGKNSSVRGTNSIAVGPDASVNNGNSAVLEQSTAIGFHAAVAADNSTALGANASVLASDGAATAIGANSQAKGANATAIGANVGAGENSVVIGGGTSLAAARAGKDNATAIGTYVDINADKGTAIGYGAQIGWNGKNSVSLGADSTANEADVVSVGHVEGQANGFGGIYSDDLKRRIINVADGVNDSDAATVGQIKTMTGVDAELGAVVQYDDADKNSVTFQSTDKAGTTLNNVNDITMNVETYLPGTSIVQGYKTVSFKDAGIIPGTVSDEKNIDSVVLGRNSNAGDKHSVVIGVGARTVGSNATAIGQGASADANNSMAIGSGSKVTGSASVNGTAVGTGSGVTAEDGTALGYHAYAWGEGATVIGSDSRSYADGGTTLGQNARIQEGAENSVALGKNSYVSKDDILASDTNGVVSVGISTAGTDDTGMGVSSTPINRRIINVADGVNDNDAATVGQLNAMQSAYTDSGIVGGTMDKNTLATGAVAIGKDSNVHGTGSIAIGTGSKVEKYNSVAIGRNAIVKGAGSVALGASSVATEDNVLSLGRNDGSLGLRIVNMKDGINERDAVTVGQMNALALGDRKGSLSLANGATNLADGIDRNTTAIKSLDEQLEDVKVDWGESTQSMKELTEKASAFAAQTQNVDWNALNSVDWNAVSAMAAVPATMNLAVDDVQANEGDTGAEKDDDDRSPQTNGSNPGEVDGNLHVSGNTTLDGTLNVKGDATFEGNATFDKGATMKGDLNMSGNKITGLGAGDVSADSTDAVNGSQLFDVQQQVSDNRNAIGALGSRVSDLGEEVDSVGAISAALAGLHPLDYNGTGSKFQISAALGTYDGTQAAAIGGFYHFNRDTLLSIGGSTSFEGDRKTAANIGLTFRVGEGASEAPAVQDTETKQQMEAMKQEIEMLKAELEQLKNKDTEGTNAKN